MLGAALLRPSPAQAILVLLAVMSLVSVAIILRQAMALRREGRPGARDAAVDAWADGNRPAAEAAFGAGRTAADRLGRLALAELGRGTGREAMAARLAAAGNGLARELHRGLRTLDTIAVSAPLLGLLGTVLGMIESFRALEMAGGAANASVLAGGIWQALLTTAAGLIVALPAAVGAALLSSRAEAATQELEATLAACLALAGTGR